MSNNMSQEINTEPTIDSSLESEATASGQSNSGVASTSSTQTEREVIKEDVEKFYLGDLTHLTNEQWEIIEYVWKLLNDNTFRSKNQTDIFLDGVVGSGKTEVAKILCEYVEGRFGEDTAFYAASYGPSALNYRKGKTGHATFNLPLAVNDDEEFWNLDENNEYHSKKLDKLRACSLIVYDDVTSVDNRYLKMLNRSFQRLLNSDQLFGGKIIILAGDFRQLAPVDERARIFDKDLILNISPKTTNWTNLRRFYLSTYKRTSNDIAYTNFLKKVAIGRLEGMQSTRITDVTFIPLPKFIQFTLELDEIIDFIYPDEHLKTPVTNMLGKAILVPRNKERDLINEHIMRNRLPGPTRTYNATSVEVDENGDIVYGDFENDANEIPERNLDLKKGALCVIIRTIYNEGNIILRNGEKVVVEDMLDDYIMVTNIENGLPYALARQQFDTCNQFPLKVCFAITIHKSQGQNLQRVAVDLRVPESYFTTAIFRHGQLLTALGRVRSAKDIMLLVEPKHFKNDLAHTHNLVHPELVVDYVNEVQDLNMEVE